MSTNDPGPEAELEDVILASNANGRLLARQLLKHLAELDAERPNLEEAARALLDVEKYDLELLRRVNEAAHAVAHSVTDIAKLHVGMTEYRAGRRPSSEPDVRAMSAQEAIAFIERLMGSGGDQS